MYLRKCLPVLPRKSQIGGVKGGKYQEGIYLKIFLRYPQLLGPMQSILY